MPTVTITNDAGEPQGSFEANADESIGVQAQDQGIDVPFSCGAGACRTCVAVVKKGAEHLDPEAVGSRYIDTEENEVLTCICSLKPDTPANAKIDLQALNI